MSEGMKDESELVTKVWRGTERRMYPEVAQFLSEYSSVRWAYDDALEEAQHAQSRAERVAYREAEAEGRSFDTYASSDDRAKRAEWRRAYTEARDAATAAFSNRRAELQALLTNSPHREVAWIGKEIVERNDWTGEVGSYARDILAILPATTEQIWEEAKQNRGMCDVFDRYFDQAEAAGVFSGGASLAGAREIAAFRNWVRRNWGSSYVTDMTSHLDRVTKALRDAHAKELADAKAEWQRLDEARAENATFNRSQAQKARYERERAAVAATAAVADDSEESPVHAQSAVHEAAKALVEDDEPQPASDGHRVVIGLDGSLITDANPVDPFRVHA